MLSGVAIASATCDRCDHSEKVPEVEGLHDHRVSRKLSRVHRRAVVAGEHDQSGRETRPELIQIRDNSFGAIGSCERVGHDHVAMPAVDRRAGGHRIFDEQSGVTEALDQRGANVVVVLDHED